MTYSFSTDAQLEAVLTALEHGAEAMDYEMADSPQAAILRSIAKSLQDHNLTRESSPR